MRALILALLLAGCHGEEVTAPLEDASTDSSPGTETASDVAVDTGAAVDTAGDASTVRPGCSDEGNLIPNGSFTLGASGWTSSDLTLEPIVEGPCGYALRAYGSTRYANFRRRVFVKLDAGTKLRLTAYNRDNGSVKGGDTPGVIARFGRMVDGGELNDDQVVIPLALPTLWTYGEQTGVLTVGAEFVDLLVTSSRVDGLKDDFAVTGISLTIVK